MTRDDLRGIVEGISEEQLKKILDINSSDIGRAKQNLEELKKQLEVANEKTAELEKANLTLGESQCEADKMKEKIEELQKVIDQKEEAEKAENLKAELSRRFELAAGGTKFINEFTRSGIFEQFKTAVFDEKNAGRADSDVYCELVSGKENLFVPAEGVPKVVASTPGFGGSITDGDVREIMGLSRTV
ncbi:MAG: hypothetical protein IJV86_00955 [Clostridia bacterium]|nr:hypothetical protein [Clostridia bacterium]